MDSPKIAVTVNPLGTREVAGPQFGVVEASPKPACHVSCSSLPCCSLLARAAGGAGSFPAHLYGVRRCGVEMWGYPDMNHRPVNLSEKFTKFTDHWAPRIIAQMNDYHIKLARIQGEFVWHSHAETDEVFVVLDGEMRIHFRDGATDLRAGEMIVVPKGIEHKPSALRECKIMLVERAGTVNTGDAGGPKTAADGVWI